MTLDEAIVIVQQQVLNTGISVREVVDTAWSDLKLSHTDIQILAMEGLSGRVIPGLINPFKRKHILSADNEEISAVMVLSRPSKPTLTQVTCTLLSEITYEVEGVRKAVIEFTFEDVRKRIFRLSTLEKGVSAHRDLWEQIQRHLVDQSKLKVEELNESTQLEIARQFYNLQNNASIALA